MSGIVIFEAEAQQVEVRLEGESIWLTQKQMAELFNKNVRTVSEHIKNIFREGDLEKDSVIRNFRITAAGRHIGHLCAYRAGFHAEVSDKNL